MSNDYKFGPPEFIGSIPVRQELLVKPPTDPTRKIGWKVHSEIGSDAYLVPEGTNTERMDITDAWDLAVETNLITTPYGTGLKAGDKLLVHTLFGWDIGIITTDSRGQPTCTSESGNRRFPLKFATDRTTPEGEPKPPRWICLGSVNIKGIKKLEITR